ncbi:MAG: hypothetical protein V3R87_12960 [Dehalococcoidia bacterium]
MSDGGTLGIDPGMNSGAVVWLEADRKTVRMWWVWLKMKPRKDGRIVWRLKTLAGDMDCACLGEVLHTIRHAIDIDQFGTDAALGFAALSIEGLFVADRKPSKKNPLAGALAVQSVLMTAESVGEIRHALRGLSSVEHRPTSSTWRPQAAGIPARTDAAIAEALAIQYARALFTWPMHGQKLTKAEKGAIAEAAFIGKWAQDQEAMRCRKS